MAPVAAKGSIDSRVLVVDDDPFIRDLVFRWLDREGYPCALATHGQEALEQLRHTEVELMICDIDMPHMGGLQLVPIVLRHYPRTAVIMLTGNDDRETAVKILEAGAYGYLIKPVSRNELLIAVANALLRRQYALEQLKQVRQAHQEIALRLVTASAWRDYETGAHVRRIGAYCAVLARSLGWHTEDADNLQFAAALHDIGKLGIPDSILQKPGKLTSAEFERMKTHTMVGAAMLAGSDIPLLQLARELVLRHHEKWDGSGYPEGLAGDQIPQSACIVAVADVYDALVHKRVYKPAFSEQETVRIMKKGRGCHFAPEVLDCFLELLSEFRRIRKDLKDADEPNELSVDALKVR